MKMITIEAATKGAGPNLSAGAVEYCGTGTVLRIEQSIAYMAQHLDQPLQVATLAALANISPSHFFALFKRRIGSAPMDYFTRLRMQRARDLLDVTAASVKEIAATLGYNDPFYFSRVFKSVNQIAPSEYRVMSKERNEALRSAASPPVPPAPAGQLAPGPARQRSQSPVLEPLARTGQNGSAQFSHQKNKYGKNRSIFHSTTTDLYHNK
jgi:AraC-like DNA-binding protein